MGVVLLFFWKSSINLTIEDLSNYYIDVCIDKNTMQEWRFTGFYGEPKTTRRSEAWDSLRSLNHHPNTPRLCAGDFNELVRQDEKLGRAIRSNNQIQLFRDVIDECGFMDLGCDSLDHVPLFLNLSSLEPPPRKKSSRFEEMWLSDNRCGETVVASWCSSISKVGEDAIIKKVERCGKDLAWWNRNIFGNVKLELERKRKMLV